ncbi:MAG TPA: anti-sigma factor [Candidatus Limnocylindrales bacterium]
MTCDRVCELASGFVLGALDSGDMIAVSDHLDRCQKPHPEIAELGGVLPYIADSLEPVEAPVWLRESVIAAARADLAAGRRVGKPAEHRIVEPRETSVATPAPVLAFSHAEIATTPASIVSLSAVRASRRRRAATWVTRIAAAVAILGLSGYSFNLQSELRRAQQISDANASILHAMGEPDTRRAVFIAADGSAAGGLAALRPTGHIMLNVYGLAKTQGNEVYVVWLSSGNGSPTSSWTKAGSFTVDDSGRGYLEVDNAPTSSNLWLYVCREANGNVLQPTGPRVLTATIWL